MKHGDPIDIQVWSVDPTAAAFDSSSLPDEDRRRAELLPNHRQAVYVASRVALLQLLSSALGTDPLKIEITRTCRHCGHLTHGKPSVASGTDKIDFNVSYSAGLALIALGFSVHVGVDIQDHIGGVPPFRWCFSSSERTYLEALDDRSREVELTHAWARKEALAKADGRGLVLPLTQVIATGPRSMWKLPTREWQLDDLDVGDGYAAALAYDSPRARVEFIAWMGDGSH